MNAANMRANLNVPTRTGGNASGTWGINITGSAGSVAWANVTGKPSTFPPSSHTHSYLPLSGGTLSGTLKWSNALTKVTSPTVVAAFISNDSANGLGYASTSDLSVGRASLLSIHNTVTSTTTRSTNASSWTGGISGVNYMWGQAFKDTAIGTDTGDIVFAVRAGQYTSGGTELCVCIDGDYYSMGNKVLHAGNYSSYALPRSGGTLSGNVTVQKASGSTIVSVNNTSAGKINLQVSDSGNKGIYDSNNSKWIIYSGSDNITKVPSGQTVSTAAVRNIKILAPGTSVTPGTTAMTTGEIWMRYE